MAKKTQENFFFYLKRALIEDYRIIKSVDVTFNTGLNIIIGKNGSGKTSFLNALSRALDLGENNSPFSAHLRLEGDKKFEIIYRGLKKDINLIKNTVLNNEKVEKLDEIEIRINNRVVKIEDEIFTTLDKKKISFNTIFIQHGIPDEKIALVNSPFSFSLGEDELSDEIFQILWKGETSQFLRSILTRLLFETLMKDPKANQKEYLVEFLSIFDKHFRGLAESLNKFTPIQDIRFNKNYNIFNKENENKYIIDNLFIEYKINDSWLPFSSLSDGTKRMFYIFSEVYFSDSFYYRKNVKLDFLPKPSIVLIEEPELGVHPHQLHQLMLFLQEQATNKQIIITTHSPQILDFISVDELDKILIAKYIPIKGTSFTHLTEAEKAKATAYMKRRYLSDYWRFSDLED